MSSLVSGFDYSLFHLVNGVWLGPWLDYLMPFLSRIGNLGVIWLVLLSIIAVFGKQTGRRVTLAGFVALVAGFACSELIKVLTMRPRPFLVLSDVRLLVAVPHSYAFPSGHTTNSFAAAAGVAIAARRLIGGVPIWNLGMFVLAAAISYSRVYVGVHWPTDVAAGIALGVASGWLGSRLVTGCAGQPSAGPGNRRKKQKRRREYNMAGNEER